MERQALPAGQQDWKMKEWKEEDRTGRREGKCSAPGSEDDTDQDLEKVEAVV